ncbi:MAG TPA: hypothetical protein VHE35_10415, partial [Kofleriaceae bacterium]|nr:hypothetical protein [Kofleriaceae bacterium]
MSRDSEGPSIWWWAFGYFACYVPYTTLTKLLSHVDGSTGRTLIDTGGTPVGGLEILPPTVMASVVTMVLFLVGTGWWRHAGRKTIAGVSVPVPRGLTAISGLCSSGIIATTTLAYTFGASPLVAALFMKGGVLVIAPVIDRISRRRVRWFSWTALALALASLAVASGGGKLGLTAVLLADLAVYLTSYFVRLTLMSSRAKSADTATNLRYFVEELMVSTPALVAMLGLGALALGGKEGAELRAGFTTFFERPVVLHAIAIGVLSQGTGIFGGLTFLDKRENTFCVPVNRASSVLAVLVASLYMSAVYATYPSVARTELEGAALIIAAIGFLTIPPALAKRRAART